MKELIVNLRNLVAIKGWSAAELSRQLNVSPLVAKNLMEKDDVSPRDKTISAIEALLAGKVVPAKEKVKSKAKPAKAETVTEKPKRGRKPAAEDATPEVKDKVVKTQVRKPKIKDPEVDVERLVMLNLLSEVGLMDEVIRRVTMVKGDSQ